ncbi:alpha-hydroxy-acid oxidizing protein [Absicoccus intestinalis]|uniref:Alpha-hydroxy-acid oxidizing protein n=1 Tax=Absicoccus intestinalis TaxID=2926319 RepID=A0ABU4WQY0_9FIRM|nr:alpha-hydroxy-acid oxidizing protein [Absicoccus sp. CLA-KB-P134]MDX8417940.1 alpha-hydroxy-acid oxidizing protein [Absicoccus sp. CLA-KB-P134]
MNETKTKWPGPPGLIPVTSGRADDANQINRHYLDRLMVEMRVIDARIPDLHTEIFGKLYDSPIMMPAFSHLNKAGIQDRQPMEEYAKAATILNIVNWVGMESDEEYENIAKYAPGSIRIIKPFADHHRIRSEIQFAKSQGAIAVGIDIDHIAGKDGNFDIVDGIPLGPIFQADLKAYVQEAGIPFIAKGVLSVQDACIAANAGCAAIVVSHHHGRIPYGIPPLALLPNIKKALQKTNVKIFVDCGMDSGYDAYKALALGADALSVGRSILKPLLKDGSKGVVSKIQHMNEELKQLMLYTSIANTSSFDPSVIHYMK